MEAETVDWGGMLGRETGETGDAVKLSTGEL